MAIDKTVPTTDRSSLEVQVDEKSSKSDFSDDMPTPPPEKLDEEPEWLDLLGSGSIMKKIIKEGYTDTKPQRLETCTITYDLSLPSGTFIERKENQEIQLGDCDVVQGLDVAIGLMNIGEKCVLKIEPRLAFGAVGLPPKIPPHATVVYEIELVSVRPEEDPGALSVLERKSQGFVYFFLVHIT